MKGNNGSRKEREERERGGRGTGGGACWAALSFSHTDAGILPSSFCVLHPSISPHAPSATWATCPSIEQCCSTTPHIHRQTHTYTAMTQLSPGPGGELPACHCEYLYISLWWSVCPHHTGQTPCMKVTSSLLLDTCRCITGTPRTRSNFPNNSMWQ